MASSDALEAISLAAYNKRKEDGKDFDADLPNLAFGACR